MSKYLFNVADVWNRTDHVVILSDVPESQLDVRQGDLLELRLPDGKKIEVKGAIVMFDPPAERPLAVALHGLTPADVPVGTEVWLVNAERKPWKPDRRWKPVS